MKCLVYELSSFWNVLYRESPVYEMYVCELFIYEMSVYEMYCIWKVQSMKCSVYEMYVDELSIYDMSVYEMSQHQYLF